MFNSKCTEQYKKWMRKYFEYGELQENSVNSILETIAAELILEDSRQVTHEVAKSFTESEFEKFKVLEDKKYISNFDKFILLKKKK
jgi:hypothetical protein